MCSKLKLRVIGGHKKNHGRIAQIPERARRTRAREKSHDTIIVTPIHTYMRCKHTFSTEGTQKHKQKHAGDCIISHRAAARAMK